jgi:putative spermidine/putrescine transport system ATP-binding protein/spermidine/putrescine transport system ATP-binding protein
MQVEVKDIQRKLGVTTLFVTHDQSEALSLSDRIAVMAAGTIRQLGTPEEVYRRPADRFVASFVGDVNVLTARLDHIDGDTAIVMLGAARVPVLSRPLQDLASGAAVDLFVRPEGVRVVEHAEDADVRGVVAARVYQGGHVDLYADVPEASSGRVLLRIPGQHDLSHWPVGSRIGIAFAAGTAAAFPPERG